MYSKNILLITLFALFYSSVSAQKHEDTFSYTDAYGQTISIVHSNTLPKGIDTTFLRKNLTSKHLSTVSDSVLLGKVNYLITEIIPYKKKNNYQITLKLYPKSQEVYEQVRDRRDEYFLMTTYRKGKNVSLVDVTYMFSKVKL